MGARDRADALRDVAAPKSRMLAQPIHMYTHNVLYVHLYIRNVLYISVYIDIYTCAGVIEDVVRVQVAMADPCAWTCVHVCVRMYECVYACTHASTPAQFPG